MLGGTKATVSVGLILHHYWGKTILDSPEWWCFPVWLVEVESVPVFAWAPGVIPSAYFLWFISQAQFCYVSMLILHDWILQGHCCFLYLAPSLSTCFPPSLSSSILLSLSLFLPLYPSLPLTLCFSVLWLANSKTHVLPWLHSISSTQGVHHISPPFLEPHNFHWVFIRFVSFISPLTEIIALGYLICSIWMTF